MHLLWEFASRERLKKRDRHAAADELEGDDEADRSGADDPVVPGCTP
jgi:hypothetical protein